VVPLSAVLASLVLLLAALVKAKVCVLEFDLDLAVLPGCQTLVLLSINN
jgi:hypothetical protein